MKLNTCINYGGNCKQAFRFYEEHLGGKITMMMTHGSSRIPATWPPEWKGAILHARINIGETVLMGADIRPDRFSPMRSAYLSLTVGSVEEAERIYLLLSDGGEIFMPMQETFFVPLRDAQGQVRHVVDDPLRTSKPATHLVSDRNRRVAATTRGCHPPSLPVSSGT